MDDYSESIDWDEIYSAFHDPKSVADRISAELDDVSAPLIFCGFPAVASYLAAESPVQFVDYSPVITARSRERFPNIQQIVNGEITDVLKDNATQNVVIACRLSAFWQSQKAFDQLASALLASPRKQVLIDFFDRDAVCTGQSINYEAASDTGAWNLESFDKIPQSNPLIEIANISVCYAVGSTHFSYEARRAFFKKPAIKSWFKGNLADYSTVIADPLLNHDPSFLLKLTHS